MPPCRRVRTRVQGTIPNYSYMAATRVIKRGDQILGEEPLAQLPVSLSDLHDDARFLVPNVPHNGLESIQKMFNGLSAAKQRHLNQLYNAQPGTGLLTLFSTNAFLDEEKMRGHNFRVLRVYENISRVNHSCRPNAALAYDADKKIGTLRALRDIQQGEEIFLNYRPDEQFTFSDVPKRRQTLQVYNFTCNCPSCTLTGHALRDDRNNGREALQRFNDISPEYPQFTINQQQQKNTHLIHRLQRATKYITYLQTLHIADGKLAWAYGKVAELHIDIWELLRTLQIQAAVHCQLCRNNAQG